MVETLNVALDSSEMGWLALLVSRSHSFCRRILCGFTYTVCLFESGEVIWAIWRLFTGLSMVSDCKPSICREKSAQGRF